MFSCSGSLFWNQKMGRGWGLYRCFEVAMKLLFVGCSPQDFVVLLEIEYLKADATKNYSNPIRDMSTLRCFECFFWAYLSDFDYPKLTAMVTKLHHFLHAPPWGRNPALQVDFPHLGSFGVMDYYASLAWLREMKVLFFHAPTNVLLNLISWRQFGKGIFRMS